MPNFRAYLTPRNLLLTALVLAAGIGIAVYRAPVDGDHALNAFMADTYGRYSKKLGYWPIHSDGDIYAHRLCAQEAVELDGAPHLFVAVCGFTPEGSSHAQAGQVDFYILKRLGNTLQTEHRLRDVDSGSFGQPGDVSVVRLGPAFYGFKLMDGAVGQGVLSTTTRLLIPGQEGLTEGFSIQTMVDNEGSGACKKGSRQCIQVNRTVTIDDSTSKDGAYPLQVAETGILEGRKVDRKFKVTFNPSQWQYQAPKGLVLDLD